MTDAARVYAQPVIDGSLPKAKGFQQLTDATLGASTGLTVPSGTTIAYIQAEAVSVRWRPDAVAPTATVGMLLAAGENMIYAASETELAALRFIRTAANAVLNVSYY